MKESILGVEVTRQNYEELSSSMLSDIENDRKSFVVAINPEKIMKAQKDKSLLELLNKASYQIPDGIGVVIASKLKKGKINSRVTGIDLMLKICEMAEQHSKKVFLYGAKPGVCDRAREALLIQFPNLQIVGTQHGYEKDTEKIISDINDSGAEVLFVALGSPTQENWIIEHMNELNVNVFQGVGGSFDVICGNINRAPSTMQKVGLEWLYRLYKEPKRWKRQLVLPEFLIKVLKSR